VVALSLILTLELLIRLTMRSSLISTLLLAAVAIATPIDETSKSTIKEASASRDASAGAADCKPIIMLYARGTWEPGSPPSQVAAPLIKALNAKYPGKVDAQIVLYDGGATGYLTGGSTEGTQKMEQMTNAAVQQCPNAKIVLIGYR
jgi:hypothetical protein